MRAILVVNPVATTTTVKTRNVLAGALASELKVDVVETTHRGHAHELAQQARRDGLDVVVALGGDGTINEVVNGLLSAGPGPDVPILATVPGGSTNVFTRALGMSRDPIEATAEILDLLRGEQTRTISLGKADERWFTFTSGIGFDADVIARVERRRAAGRRASAGLYIGAAVTEFLTGPGRRRPHLTVELPGRESVSGVFLCLVSNVNPWTYVRSWAVRPSPEASFETGLDLFALRKVGVARMLRHVGQSLRGGLGPRGRHVLAAHDASWIRLRSQTPLDWQVDGDWAGQRQELTLISVPDALRVVAAPADSGV
ncbi:MAG: diacylglycerol kinase family lipid kinase [Actinomycetota bacterium]|nr:diacylglycerol kinase family lipid kinase [Actinomycetota bacterium]